MTKYFLIIISLLFSTLTLSESVNSFCADLVREKYNPNPADPCENYAWQSDGYRNCTAQLDFNDLVFNVDRYFYEYDWYKLTAEQQMSLGMSPYKPSMEEQFSHCVKIKTSEDNSNQQDDNFLRYLDQY